MRAIRALMMFAALGLPALAHAADPFAGFRIPAHGWRSGTASLGLSHSGQREFNSAVDEARRADSRGELTGSLAQVWDSDALRWSLSLHGSGRLIGTRDETFNRYDDGAWDRLRQGQTSEESWSVLGGLRSYPWPVPVGLDLTARIDGFYSQSWRLYDARMNRQPPSAESFQDRQVDRSHGGEHEFSLAGSIGLGRVRDATVVMDVHVLEQRLLAAGAIGGPLSARTRERLAALEATAPSLAEVFDRPDRRLWRAIESILRQDGSLGDRSLDAYALSLAREPYRFANARPVGWFVGPTVTLMHEGAHGVSRSEWSYLEILAGTPPDTVQSYERSSRRSTYYLDSAWLGASAEYHRPLGWNWQVDALASASGPVRPGDSGVRTSMDGVATWLIADRWQAQGRVDQMRLYYAPRAGRGLSYPSTWQVTYGATLGYYIEDHVLLQLALNESQRRQLGQFDDHDYLRDDQATLSATYRFLGRIEAPGLLGTAQPER